MARTSTASAPTTCRIATTIRTDSWTSRCNQKLSRNLRGYFDTLNLNDALLRYYQGVKDRVLQEEHYHWWLNSASKVDF